MTKDQLVPTIANGLNATSLALQFAATNRSLLMPSQIRPYALAAILFALISACDVGSQSAPNEEKIKGNLMGNVIGNVFIGPAWRFSSLAAIGDLEIAKTIKMDNTVEQHVNIKLNDPNGDKYEAKLTIVHRLEQGEWKLVSLSDNGTLKRIKKN